MHVQEIMLGLIKIPQNTQISKNYWKIIDIQEQRHLTCKPMWVYSEIPVSPIVLNRAYSQESTPRITADLALQFPETPLKLWLLLTNFCPAHSCPCLVAVACTQDWAEVLFPSSVSPTHEKYIQSRNPLEWPQMTFMGCCILNLPFQYWHFQWEASKFSLEIWESGGLIDFFTVPSSLNLLGNKPPPV